MHLAVRRFWAFAQGRSCSGVTVTGNDPRRAVGGGWPGMLLQRRQPRNSARGHRLRASNCRDGRQTDRSKLKLDLEEQEGLANMAANGCRNNLAAGCQPLLDSRWSRLSSQPLPFRRWRLPALFQALLQPTAGPHRQPRTPGSPAWRCRQTREWRQTECQHRVQV